MEILRRGSKGESVKKLQIALNLLPDGIFGPLTEEAVKEFKKANKLGIDGIVDAMTWIALERKIGPVKRSVRTIKEIIVHCSATPEGKDYTVAQIKAWHLARNFSDIGYHYVIYRDGTLHLGRDVNLAGAHCTNHNSFSIGICYIGGCDVDGKQPKDTRTPEQKAALIKLLTQLKKLYPNAKIHSHKDFAAKACPSFDATKEYDSIK